jgi:23S rRNA pseudouridine1911/1915/1917 synthase
VGTVRLDRFLADAAGLSRARIKEAFERGEVRVDGRRARKGDRAAAGSEVTAELPDETSEPVADDTKRLVVLFEDVDLIVVNKPAGMPSHPLENGERGTLGNALVGRNPECAAAGHDPRECGLVHRLDTETSGVLMAAKRPETYAALRRAFGAREVEKRYLALVGGAPGEGGEIDLPLAHDPRSARRMTACATEEEATRLKARPAVTRYRVLERTGDLALLEVDISTGVMHQIRVHLSAIGAPVAGDALYGGPLVPGLSRQFLHAARIAFRHPTHGEKVTVEAPLPDELRLVLEKLRAERGGATQILSPG